MARQLEADLAAMETEEEEPIADADVVMAEQEVVAVQNAPPPVKKKLLLLRQRLLLERVVLEKLSISHRNLPLTLKLLAPPT